MSRYSKTRLRKGIAKTGDPEKSAPRNTGTSGQEEAMLLCEPSSSRIEHPSRGEWRLKVGRTGKSGG